MVGVGVAGAGPHQVRLGLLEGEAEGGQEVRAEVDAEDGENAEGKGELCHHREKEGAHLQPAQGWQNPEFIYCCGSGIFIPDSGSDFSLFSIPDPGYVSKNLIILTQKNGFQALGNMIRVVHISDPDTDFLPIPDPRVKKAPDPGSAALVFL
jgi:hypothetical protein